MTEVFEEEIPKLLDDERVDKVVATIGDVTRAEAAELITNGSVIVDGVAVSKGSQRLREGQIIHFSVADTPVAEVEPDPNILFDVVYEDEDVIVVNKPAGLPVHPGAGRPNGTLVNGLLNRYPELADIGETHRPGIVHRLDSGTTGLLVVARNEFAYTSLVEQLSNHDAQRGYVCLVHGSMQSNAGSIDAPVGRSQRDRTKMGVTASGKQAVTHYVVEERFNEPAEYSFLNIELETGRTHQIRVHLTAIDHPIVGDDVYGGSRGPISSDRPLLHAQRLSFTHPRSGETGEFQAALPADFEQILANLRELAQQAE